MDGRSKLLDRIRQLALIALVLLIFTVPRLSNIGQYVTADEPMYLREAGGFYYALSHREFAATDRVVQPGVTTLWLGTIGYLLRFPDYNELGELYIADLHFDLLLKKAQLIPLQILVYAPARMMIGWGEGLDEAARFLNRQADLKHKKVYAWYASAQNCHFSEIAEDLPISQPIMT